MPRAAHFPPLLGGERAAYWVYQLSTAALILGLFAVRVRSSRALLPGMVCYLLGLTLLAGAVAGFCAPSEDGLFSRNPMYAACFVFFAGCCLLTASWPLTAALACFQVSAHWIILAEERWCLKHFGETYRE